MRSSLAALLPFTLAALTAAEPAGPRPIERITGAGRAGIAAAVRVEDAPLLWTAKLFAVDTARDSRSQVESVLDELASLLAPAGGDLDRVVRLNVYVADDTVTPFVDAVLAQRFAESPPAVTVVRSELERSGARVALDAVAAVERRTTAVEKIGARGAVLPAGAKVFISGQAESRAGDFAGSVALTMEKLHASVAHLGLAKSDIAHVKAFVQPMSEHAKVKAEIEKSFGGAAVPPIVMTEWISTTPAEIELVVAARAGRAKEPVSFLSFPGMTSSPYFSRATMIAPGTPLIFFSAIESGGGGSAREQWKRVFAQFGGALLDAGSSFRHLAKATYYLADPAARQAMGEIRGVYYDPARPPAASAADVKGLGRAGDVLLDMIAVPSRPDSRPGK